MDESDFYYNFIYSRFERFYGSLKICLEIYYNDY